ncbi:hypothetical protein BDY24DRAFT_396257 [Mrakia frigida]|uniref:uncharacterized protein n=1 Tax=Mrakia frigida TaxID=29902 RepID=UPI003FCC0666
MAHLFPSSLPSINELPTTLQPSIPRNVYNQVYTAAEEPKVVASGTREEMVSAGERYLKEEIRALDLLKRVGESPFPAHEMNAILAGQEANLYSWITLQRNVGVGALVDRSGTEDLNLGFREVRVATGFQHALERRVEESKQSVVTLKFNHHAEWDLAESQRRRKEEEDRRAKAKGREVLGVLMEGDEEEGGMESDEEGSFPPPRPLDARTASNIGSRTSQCSHSHPYFARRNTSRRRRHLLLVDLLAFPLASVRVRPVRRGFREEGGRGG